MRVHAQWGGGVLRGHLANGDDTTGPGQSPAQDVFFLRLVGPAARQINAKNGKTQICFYLLNHAR